MHRNETTRKSSRTLWRKAGTLDLPAGQVSDVSRSASTTLLNVKQRANALRTLFDSYGVQLAPNSSVAKLIADAQGASDAWLLNTAIEHRQLFNAILFDRIADALLPLAGDRSAGRYLQVLSRGDLDLFSRSSSQAKSLLWELELWALLRRRSFNAELSEPDIVVEAEGLRIAIACKKLYSERHVQNVLSQAVHQIEPAFDVGIVALNLDDLLPPDVVLRVEDHSAVADRLNSINEQFLREHERHLLKYLNPGRMVGVFVSTSVLADLFRQRIRFNNVRQATIWTVPGLPAQKQRAVNELYRGMFGALPPLTLGRQSFAQISAVEGIRMPEHLDQQFRTFEAEGLKADERRRVLLAKYTPVKIRRKP